MRFRARAVTGFLGGAGGASSAVSAPGSRFGSVANLCEAPAAAAGKAAPAGAPPAASDEAVAGQGSASEAVNLVQVLLSGHIPPLLRGPSSSSCMAVLAHTESLLIAGLYQAVQRSSVLQMNFASTLICAHARQLRGNVEQYTGPSTAGVTFGPQPRTLSPDSDDDGDDEGSGGGAGWLGLLRACLRRRNDKESLACYLLYAVLFVADMSVLALVFPAALYLYALLVNPPARRFWQVCTNALRTLSLCFILQVLAGLALHSISARTGIT